MSDPQPVPTRIDDWARPRIPVPLRLFNALAEYPTRVRVKVDVDSLMADAVKRTGSTTSATITSSSPWASW